MSREPIVDKMWDEFEKVQTEDFEKKYADFDYSSVEYNEPVPEPDLSDDTFLMYRNWFWDKYRRKEKYKPLQLEGSITKRDLYLKLTEAECIKCDYDEFELHFLPEEVKPIVFYKTTAWLINLEQYLKANNLWAQLCIHFIKVGWEQFNKDTLRNRASKSGKVYI